MALSPPDNKSGGFLFFQTIDAKIGCANIPLVHYNQRREVNPMGKATPMLSGDEPKISNKERRRKLRELRKEIRSGEFQRAVREDTKRLLGPFFRKVQKQRGFGPCQCSKGGLCPRHTPITA